MSLKIHQIPDSQEIVRVWQRRIRTPWNPWFIGSWSHKTMPDAFSIWTPRPNLTLIFGRSLQLNSPPYATGPLPCLSVCNVAVSWPNGWMDQDATWYGGRPRPRWHCVRWGVGDSAPPTLRGTAAPHFLAHVCCGQVVAHLSNCWALVHVSCLLWCMLVYYCMSACNVLGFISPVILSS